MKYTNIREEDIKNTVATNFFEEFDCNKFVDFIDFAVNINRSINYMNFPNEYLLCTESKRTILYIYKFDDKKCKKIIKNPRNMQTILAKK